MTPELYFVERAVRDPSAAAAWYARHLGATEAMRDPSGDFVLLGVGGSRLAFKRGEPTPGGVTLAFRVEDLSAWADRWAAQGVAFDAKRSEAEKYTRLRATDADGYAVVLFAWGDGT